MFSTESDFRKKCDNCAYFYKIEECSNHGYCFWLLRRKNKQINSKCCCMNWIDKNDNKAFYLDKLYTRAINIKKRRMINGRIIFI